MVEGAFARAFRSSIRPVELARRLAREMDDHVSIGVRGQPVAPNHFTVYLSPDDHREFGEVQDALRRELADAARAHARDEGYSFMGPVQVEVVVDETFGTGWFEIEGRFREGAGGAGAGSLVLPTWCWPCSSRVTGSPSRSTSSASAADPSATSCSPTPT